MVEGGVTNVNQNRDVTIRNRTHDFDFDFFFIFIIHSACPINFILDGIVSDNRITASSVLPPVQDFPSQARLNNSIGAWCAEYNNISQWIMVDLRALKLVSGIMLQGKQDIDHYVTQYKIQYRGDGLVWSHIVTPDGSNMVSSCEEAPPIAMLKHPLIQILHRPLK